MKTTSKPKSHFIEILSTVFSLMYFSSECLAHENIEKAHHRNYEAIIVGSGFGGSIAAYHLGKEGVKAVVIERGRWWTVKDPTTDSTFVNLPASFGLDGLSFGEPARETSAWVSDTCGGSIYHTFIDDMVDSAGNLIARPFPCPVSTGLTEVIGSEVNPFDRSPDLRAEGISTVAAAGVGGGSLLYNGVGYAPLKEGWDAAFPKHELPYMQSIWRELNYGKHFEKVLRVLAPTPVPEDLLATPYFEGTAIMRQLAQFAGYPLEDGSVGPKYHGAVVAPVSVNWDVVRDEINGKKVPSVILGEAWMGNNSGAKHSLDKPDNYLGMALATGNIEVKALHTVNKITFDSRSKLYHLEITRTDLDYSVLEQMTLTTRHLIMSAGSMGTTKLMVRARENGDLPRLNKHVGTRWSNNGNTLGFRFLKPTVDDPSKTVEENIALSTLGQGGTAGIKIVNYDDKENPIVLENLPQRVPHFFWGNESLRPFLGAQFNIGLGVPEKFGTWSYEKDTDTTVLKWPVDGAMNVYSGFKKIMEELPGGELYLPGPVCLSENGSTGACCSGPEQSCKAGEVKGPMVANAAQQFTAHPLGGMPFGLATDLYCRVRGYQHLYAVDGSIIPGAAAVTNPSVLISAMADRCMAKIANDIKRNKHWRH
jgi:cholesterol oxidase